MKLELVRGFGHTNTYSLLNLCVYIIILLSDTLSHFHAHDDGQNSSFVDPDTSQPWTISI